MEWHTAMEKISPYVVKVETPRGHGTGFFFMSTTDRGFCGVATAYHVVREADYWQQPMRIIYDHSGEQRFLKEEDRVIYVNPGNDSAAILFPRSDLKFPQEPLPMIPANKYIKTGVELGWVGYPAVAPTTLCFFSGRVSTQTTNFEAYFIDGVAINGVSGGPVFQLHEESPRIVGAISAYYPNVFSGGAALPGLAFAQDVTYFHEIIKTVNSMDEAREKRDEQKAQEPGPPPPPFSGEVPPETPLSK
jgi:hypothetical protein